MKRAGAVLVVLALLLAAAPGVMAKSTVTFNPLGLLVGAISAEYETDFGRDPMTLAVPVAFWSGSAEDVTLNVMGFGAGMRYYVRGVSHDGFYLGAYGLYASVRGSSDSLDVNAGVIGVSGIIGYKFLIGDSFVVDVNASVTFPLLTRLEAGAIEVQDIGGMFGTSSSFGIGVTF